MLRTGYSTKSSRLVALVTRMERISLSLSHPLPLSHSLIRLNDHSHRRLLRQITKIPSRKCTKETGSSAHRRPNQPLPAKKVIFLPSRDHQNLDLDAMYLDLEAFPTTKPRNSGSRQRGFHSSAPTHPPTSRETETQRKKKSTARPGFPAASISSFHSTHPTLSVPIPPQAPHICTPSIRRTPPRRSPTPLPHPHHPSPPPPPHKHATSQKPKNSGRNRKDGEFVLGSDF